MNNPALAVVKSNFDMLDESMLSLRLMICAFVSTLVALSFVSGGAINLEHISTIYIPYSYLSTPPRVDIDSGAVEQFAFDAPNGYAYVIGDAYLQIVDYANLTKPEIVYNHSLAHRSKDVAHCGPFVAYLLQGSDTQEPGTIYIYRKYNSQTGEFTKLHEQIIGSYPSMLTFTPNCRKILTADEGTAGDDATEQYFLNPEGMVSIIEIKGDFADPCFDLNDVTFNDFDDRRQKYADLGVRFPYNGYFTNYTEQTLSESVEPEYIAVNPRDNVAYVNLQENNAIAVLDLGTESIVKIVPLGTKSWLNLSLDPSDRDDGIIFQTGYDIKSFYMPNAIKYFEIDGVGYIATADEGSDLDYGFDRTHWGDNRRGESIHDDGQLASTVSQSLREALNDESRLGRLQFSITDGLSKMEEDKIEELFFFGGRGFSILRADHLTRVYDSGDDIERVVAQNYKEVFNSDTYPGLPDSQSPRDLADKRSDNKGPECEAVEVGVVNGKTVLFVGVRKGSVIAIYTVAADGQATFDSVHRQGGMNRTFEQLLNDRDLGDLDPKDIEFVPADQNQANRPLLMVAGAASGTLSLYYVNGSGSSTSDSDTTCRSPMGFILSFLVSILAALVANS